jgi:Transposase IS4
MRLHLVTTADDQLSRTVPSEAGLLLGTVVLQRLISPWAGSNWIVCGDSYFASVEAATHLRSVGLHFIGVVMTATRKFPTRYLQHQELEAHEDRGMLVHENKEREADIVHPALSYWTFAR